MVSVLLKSRIKFVSWKYICGEEYLDEFDKGKITILLSLAAYPKNRLDAKSLDKITSRQHCFLPYGYGEGFQLATLHV